jgi:hypothetical protein
MIPLVVTVCFLAAVGVSVGSFTRGLHPQAEAVGVVPPTDLPSGPRDAPLRLTPTVRLPGMLDSAGVRHAVTRLWKERPTSMSDTLHVVRLFGADTTWRNPDTDREVPFLDIILDCEKGRDFFHGEPPLIDTRDGVRCRVSVRRDAQWQRERQAHADQLLAVLAEMGVPLSHPLTTAGGMRSVRHLLDDMLANFDPKQQEIEWSALALALYLPPRKSWTDKFGRIYTFDDLAEELMSRPLEKAAACAGTHLLYSLAALQQADQQEPVLTAGVRAKVQAYLARHAAAAGRTLSAEGFWAPSWHAAQPGEHDTRSPVSPAASINVLVTGHQIEWLWLLPADLTPSRECFLRAARWLQVRLVTDLKTQLLENYCPYSHAARALLVLAELSPASLEKPRRPAD